MKPVLLIGILLCLLGGLALAYEGFTYTTREKVVDIGPLQATAEKKKAVRIPPVAGAVALVLGAALVFVGVRK
jgi:hypothetical protein